MDLTETVERNDFYGLLAEQLSALEPGDAPPAPRSRPFMPIRFHPAYLLLEVISRTSGPKQASRLMRAGLRVHCSYQSGHAAHRMLGFRSLVFAEMEHEAGPSRDHNAVTDSGWRWSVQSLESIRLCLGDGDFASFIEAVNSVLDATALEREAVPA